MEALIKKYQDEVKTLTNKIMVAEGELMDERERLNQNVAEYPHPEEYLKPFRTTIDNLKFQVEDYNARLSYLFLRQQILTPAFHEGRIKQLSSQDVCYMFLTSCGLNFESVKSIAKGFYDFANCELPVELLEMTKTATKKTTSEIQSIADDLLIDYMKFCELVNKSKAEGKKLDNERSNRKFANSFSGR